MRKVSISMIIMVKRWQALVGTVSHKSCVWLTSRLPLYLWFQVLSSVIEILGVVRISSSLLKMSWMWTKLRKYHEFPFRSGVGNYDPSLFALRHSFAIYP